MFSCLAFVDYKPGLSVVISKNGNRGIKDFIIEGAAAPLSASETQR